MKIRKMKNLTMNQSNKPINIEINNNIKNNNVKNNEDKNIETKDDDEKNNEN